MLSAQNYILPHLGADIRPREPALPHAGVLDIARLFHEDREAALAVADESRAAYEANREKTNADRAR